MKTTTLFSLFASAVLGSAALAEDAKLTGEASCAKCDLKLTSSCQAAITVTGADGKKEVILADKNAVAKDFHSNICHDTVKVTVEGKVTEKDGAKTIELTKIEEAK
jgi:hypothetical protein